MFFTAQSSEEGAISPTTEFLSFLKCVSSGETDSARVYRTQGQTETLLWSICQSRLQHLHRHACFSRIRRPNNSQQDDDKRYATRSDKSVWTAVIVKITKSNPSMQKDLDSLHVSNSFALTLIAGEVWCCICTWSMEANPGAIVSIRDSTFSNWVQQLL